MALKLGVLASAQMTPEIAGEVVLSESLYSHLDVAGVVDLVVEGLVAVRLHVVDVDGQVELVAGTEGAGVVLRIVEIGVEGAAGEGDADVLERARVA